MALLKILFSKEREGETIFSLVNGDKVNSYLRCSRASFRLFLSSSAHDQYGNMGQEQPVSLDSAFAWLTAQGHEVKVSSDFKSI